MSSERLAEVSEHDRRLLSSNLLYLRLSLDESISDSEGVMSLVRSLFGKGTNQICGLSIMHFGQGREHRFKFDLGGMHVDDSWFVGIHLGSTLTVNVHTKFTRCRFTDCDVTGVGKRSGLYEAYYDDNCELDIRLAGVLNELANRVEVDKGKKTAEVKRFLASFNNGYDFSRIRKRTSLVGEFVSRTGTRTTELIDILIRNGFIEAVPDQDEIAYRIIETARSSTRRFVMDGIISKELRLLVNLI